MTTKTFTLAEIATHNAKKSNWVLIHGDVYDVSEFLDEHPGGEEVLLEQGGKDASEAFEDVGHSGDARELMKRYKIGELAQADRAKMKTVPEKRLEWSSKPAAKSDAQSQALPIWGITIFAIISFLFYQLFYA